MTAKGCKEIKADSMMSLYEHLRNLRTPKRPVNKPLRMTVLDLVKIGGVGTVAIGKVETGTIKVDQNYLTGQS